MQHKNRMEANEEKNLHNYAFDALILLCRNLKVEKVAKGYQPTPF